MPATKFRRRDRVMRIEQSVNNVSHIRFFSRFPSFSSNVASDYHCSVNRYGRGALIILCYQILLFHLYVCARNKGRERAGRTWLASIRERGSRFIGCAIRCPINKYHASTITNASDFSLRIFCCNFCRQGLCVEKVFKGGLLTTSFDVRNSKVMDRGERASRSLISSSFCAIFLNQFVNGRAP